MLKQIPCGVYPTMLTPFTEDNKVDYNALEKLIEWYCNRGVAGLFAICQSSEIFYLSFEEKLEILDFVVKHTPDNVTVVASGHTADSLDRQIYEANKFIEKGIDAYVFISNRFASKEDSDEVLFGNMEKVVAGIPNIALGVYECPYPYKRLLNADILKKMSETGRFKFIKDTCCCIEEIKRRVDAVKGSDLKIFNANCTTLLDSVNIGCSGFSGVMANFHPELYAEILKCRNTDMKRAELIQNFVGFASMAECQVYPVNAKYYLSLEGIPITTVTRCRSNSELTPSRMQEIRQMRDFTLEFKKSIGLL